MAALAELPDLTARLSADLSIASVPHAISGALAMAAYGFVRATRDVDVLVAVPSVRLPEVFEIVRGHGFEGEDRDLIASLRDRFVAELRSGPTSVEILVPVLPYHHTLLDRAVRLPIAGREVPFISPEDLVVLKTIWGRTKDKADVRALVAALSASLDRDYVESTLRSIIGQEHEGLLELLALLDGG